MKYGRFRLPGSFVPGGGRLGLKYGSSLEIRDIWQPYPRPSSWIGLRGEWERGRDGGRTGGKREGERNGEDHPNV